MARRVRAPAPDAGALRKGYDWNKRCEAATVTGSLAPRSGLRPPILLGPPRRRFRWESYPATAGAGPSALLYVCHGVGDVLFSANFACRGFSEAHPHRPRLRWRLGPFRVRSPPGRVVKYRQARRPVITPPPRSAGLVRARPTPSARMARGVRGRCPCLLRKCAA